MITTKADAIGALEEALDNLSKLSEATSGEENELIHSTYAHVGNAYGFVERTEPKEEVPRIKLVDECDRAISMLRFVEAAIITGEPLTVDGAGDGLAYLLDNCCATLEEYFDRYGSNE